MSVVWPQSAAGLISDLQVCEGNAENATRYADSTIISCRIPNCTARRQCRDIRSLVPSGCTAMLPVESLAPFRAHRHAPRGRSRHRAAQRRRLRASMEKKRSLVLRGQAVWLEHTQLSHIPNGQQPSTQRISRPSDTVIAHTSLRASHSTCADTRGKNGIIRRSTDNTHTFAACFAVELTRTHRLAQCLVRGSAAHSPLSPARFSML